MGLSRLQVGDEVGVSLAKHALFELFGIPDLELCCALIAAGVGEDVFQPTDLEAAGRSRWH